jgi:hypothetical protein
MIPRSPPVSSNPHERFGALIHVANQPANLAIWKIFEKAVKGIELPVRYVRN